MTVGEALINESPNEHILRSRLCSEILPFHVHTTPAREVLPLFPELYHSAMLAGDVENALTARWTCCGFGFWSGAEDLRTLSKHTALVVREAVGVGLSHLCRIVLIPLISLPAPMNLYIR